MGDTASKMVPSQEPRDPQFTEGDGSGDAKGESSLLLAGWMTMARVKEDDPATWEALTSLPCEE